MKTTSKLIAILAVSAGLCGVARAAPPGKGVFMHATTVEQITAMKPGDQYVLVCLDCKSAKVGEITDEAEAAKLCHNGGTIHCDGCKKEVTIKRVGPPGKQHAAGTEVKYLNSEGKECMVLIPLKH